MPPTQHSPALFVCFFVKLAIQKSQRTISFKWYDINLKSRDILIWIRLTINAVDKCFHILARLIGP
jgi:hypothetical protein